MDILFNGALGRMGREVISLAEKTEGTSVAAKVDINGDGVDCLTDISGFEGKADVIIDFSFHAGTPALMDYAVKTHTPVVLATTGHTEDELEAVKNAAKEIPVFHSANMSLGVALLAELAVKTASLMPDADIEIVETHHNRKLDAPSGTALMLANAIKTVREQAALKLGRAGGGKREKNEIGIHAVRRGNLVGIHEITVSTDCETLTLKHEAHTRALFAEGALTAAEFIAGKPAGLYDMYSIVRGK